MPACSSIRGKLIDANVFERSIFEFSEWEQCHSEGKCFTFGLRDHYVIIRLEGDDRIRDQSVCRQELLGEGSWSAAIFYEIAAQSNYGQQKVHWSSSDNDKPCAMASNGL